MITSTILIVALVVSILISIIMYRRASTTLDKIDNMITQALDGDFEEKNFSEEKLSRIGSKTKQYIAKVENVSTQLEEDRESIKGIVSDISHQTKTPIANIKLYTQLLSENVELDSESAAILNQIETQTDNLSFLVSSLVNISRLETGIIKFNPTRNSVNSFVQSLYDRFYARAEAEERSLELVLGEDSKACFDFKWTTEAFSNIIDNALKYTEKGGRIIISTHEYPSFIRIDVSDDGIGISEKEQNDVFKRFYRSQDVATKQGVGLGLYLSRRIIQMEGGYIRLSSEKGKGTTFSVFLPIREFFQN